MVPQTELILKSYFQTGDTPTQAQWEELIGTMFYLYNESIAAAEAAQTAAEDALDVIEARAPVILTSFAAPTASTTPPAITSGDEYVGALSFTVAGNPATIRIPFATAFANTNYKVCTPSWSTVVGKTTTYVDVQTPTLKTFFVVIFK